MSEQERAVVDEMAVAVSRSEEGRVVSKSLPACSPDRCLTPLLDDAIREVNEALGDDRSRAAFVDDAVRLVVQDRDKWLTTLQEAEKAFAGEPVSAEWRGSLVTDIYNLRRACLIALGAMRRQMLSDDACDCPFNEDMAEAIEAIEAVYPDLARDA